MELSNNPFDYIIFILPSILGIYRWCSWIFLKLIPALLYKPIPITKNPTLLPIHTTLVIPTYEPEEPNFLFCLSTWIKSGAHIIIVADTTCYEDINKWVKYQHIVDSLIRHDQIKIIEETRPGKRPAMFRGLQNTNTEIIIYVDDDSSWNETVILSILSAFENKIIAGVGTRQIMRPKNNRATITEIMADMRLAMRYLEVRATTYMGGYTPCISGRTAAYRTSVLKRHGFEEFFMNDKFMGQLQMSGDDKCITRWIFVQPDVKMYNQICDQCTVATTFYDGMKFHKQTIRWARNTWRSDIKTVTVHGDIMWRKGTWLCLIMIDRFVSPFSMIIGLILIIIGLIQHPNEYILAFWLSWLLLSRGVKLFNYFMYNPGKIIYLFVFVIYNYISSIIKLYALCTVKNTSWLTRKIKMDANGECIRKGDMADKATAINAVNYIKQSDIELTDTNDNEYQVVTKKNDDAGGVGLKSVVIRI
jgi:cellulose synthase/poly-beta-1,6-N-acetylglucosamine synthase-like glycosyltransferase